MNFIRDDYVQISVTRLEEFIEAEIRLDILKKHMEAQSPDFCFIDKKEVSRIIGMEVLDNVN